MLIEFKPRSRESADATWIELPAEAHSDLTWSKELEQALASEKKILWFFKTGLEQPFFPLNDEFRFNALSLALQRFTKDVWPQFQEKTLGMSLYRGPVPSFPMYFQMLAHKLPDEVPIWLLLDLEPSLSYTEALQKVSQEGFEHFELALKGKELPISGHRWDDTSIFPTQNAATTGVVFPSGPCANFGFVFDQLIENEPVRVLFEAFMADQWDRLDRIHAISETLTTQGRRMLQGFAAAGGEVILH